MSLPNETLGVLVSIDHINAWIAAINANAAAISVCNARLTLETGVPISTSDQADKATLYVTPYNGNQIGLYDGSAWSVLSFSELSLDLTGYTASKPYDIFAYNNAGTVALESLIWTNDTTRATAYALQDGVKVKAGATTRRLLGSIRITAAGGKTTDSAAIRWVDNVYNQVPRQARVVPPDANWAYTTATYRQWNANAANQFDMMVSVPGRVLELNLLASPSNTSAAVELTIAIGADATNVPATGPSAATIASLAGQGRGAIRACLAPVPAVGRHYYAMIEYSTATGTTTWFGTDVLPGYVGLDGVWWC